MKCISKTIIFALVLCFLGQFVNGQSLGEFQLGLSVPQGDFADDSESNFLFDESGIAATGVYIAYKHLFALSDGGLYWTANAGLMYNGIQSDFKEDVEDELDDFYQNSDITFPNYVNIPLMLGLQYEAPMSDVAGIFGEFAFGLNFMKITNYEVEADGQDSTIIFESSNDLSYKFAIGILLNNKYTISLNYMGLGAHKVKYEVEYDNGLDDFEDKFEDPLPIKSLNVVLGIRL